MGQDAETMPLGIEQNNHLSNLTLDVWRDQIFFSKKGRRRILRLPPMPASRVKTSGYTYGSCSWQKLRNSPSFQRLYPLVFLPRVRRHGVCAADQLSCADAALQRPQRSRKGIQECHTKTKTAPPRGACGRWLDIQRTLQKAQSEVMEESSYCTPQRAWIK